MSEELLLNKCPLRSFGVKLLPLLESLDGVLTGMLLVPFDFGMARFSLLFGLVKIGFDDAVD